MAFFKKKTNEEIENQEKDRVEKEIGRYLMEGEEVLKSFGLIDRAYITNQRIIFTDKDLSFSNEKLEETIFLPIHKIDSVGIIKTTKLFAGRAVIIRSRGFTHTMRFGKEDESVIDFVNEISKLTLK